MLSTKARPLIQRTRAVVRASEMAAAEALEVEKSREALRQRTLIGEEFQRLTTQYPAKKAWPPDFTQLSPQRQFSFEKRWKRRIMQVHQAHSMDKQARLWQYFIALAIIAYVLAYGEFEWNGERHRFMTEAKHRFGYLWGYMEPDQKNVRHEDVIHVIAKDRKDRADAKRVREGASTSVERS